MHDEVDLGDIGRQELPYRIGGKSYVLREADGEVAKKYRNAAARSIKFGDEGHVVGMDGAGDIEPYLVALCLFEVLPEGQVKNTSVLLSEVTKWPSRIIRTLFDQVKQISGLDETEDLPTLEKQLGKLTKKVAKLRGGDSPAKNSPDGMTAG